MPNGSLRSVATGGEGENWEAVGTQAGFALDRQTLGEPLAAGWYELQGCLQADGGAVLPSLRFRYVDGSALGAMELMLQQPDRRGRVETLLMLYEDAESFDFLPGVGAARFRMRDFRLRRLSRAHALRKMLVGGGWRACLHRVATWRRALGRHGLKRATDALYADYRQRMQPLGFSEYRLWVRRYDTLDRPALDAYRQRAHALAGGGPRISLLLRAGGTPAASLRRCLDSVLAQVWMQWDLCVVDESLPPTLRKALDEYAASDPRIRVIAADAALTMAHGGFVIVLDAGGIMRPHALLRLAETVAADPDLAIVYSDEDQIDADGNRSEHDFKPDWNPDLLLSRNYPGHLVATRAGLVRDAGGIRAVLDGSHGYGLLLRCSEHVDARQVRHIPEVLWHAFAVTGGADTARDSARLDAEMRAVTAHLQRMGSKAAVAKNPLAPATRRVRWWVPQPAPRVSLIIPTRDRVTLLRQCVESILARSTYPDFEIVVVDNQSRERATLRYLKSLATRERVRVLRHDAPFNYSAINNWAARQCDGQLLGLINNDIEVITPAWLEEMAGLALRPDSGAIGAMLYYPDDTIQHAGMVLGVHGVAGHAYAGKPRGYPGYEQRGLVAQNLSAVTGACLLVRRELFDAAGGLDERLPVEFNDVDFCLRLLQRGYRNVWTPFAELYHHESASRSIADTAAVAARAAGMALMRDRWGGLLPSDPAYNPNLTLQGTDFALAFPPRAPEADVNRDARRDGGVLPL